MFQCNSIATRSSRSICLSKQFLIKLEILFRFNGRCKASQSISRMSDSRASLILPWIFHHYNRMYTAYRNAKTGVGSIDFFDSYGNAIIMVTRVSRTFVHIKNIKLEARSVGEYNLYGLEKKPLDSWAYRALRRDE